MLRNAQSLRLPRRPSQPIRSTSPTLLSPKYLKVRHAHHTNPQKRKNDNPLSTNALLNETLKTVALIVTADCAVESLFELLQRKKLAQHVDYLTRLENCIELGQMRLDHDPACMTPDERRRFDELKQELRRAVDGAERTMGYRHSSHTVVTEGQDGHDVLWQ